MKRRGYGLSIEEKCHRYIEDENGCWVYQGYKDHCGYGVTEIKHKEYKMHRLAWEFWDKQKIPEGMTIDHICFNRACINPAHLRLATWHENCSRHQNGNGRPLSLWCNKHNCSKKRVNWSGGRGRAYCPQCHHERYLKNIKKYKTIYNENRRKKYSNNHNHHGRKDD